MAVHNSHTTQNSVETISHNHPAAKAHLKTLKVKPPGSDCLTIWGLYLPSDDLQKREQLYQVIQNDMKVEADKATRAGLPQPYNVMAGDMNAALFKGDVQRDKLDIKDIRHQNFVKTLCLHTTDPVKQPHRQYTFRHRMDRSQDSRIDDILMSKSMCTEVLPSTEILNTSGDADHSPVLAKLPLTYMKSLKPGT